MDKQGSCLGSIGESPLARSFLLTYCPQDCPISPDLSAVLARCFSRAGVWWCQVTSRVLSVMASLPMSFLSLKMVGKFHHHLLQFSE